ncbi:MAG: tRNA (guanosine(46)-N7)-methyltransferase TrmB [Verrucomicrobia bacterium]|nr:tRNA (guanosine(46)-N7)-methyltransferase TrmB [Verrucomicrobiota bacterium]
MQKSAVKFSPGNPLDPWLSSQRLFPPYDWAEVFGRSAPVEIDLGAGDGVYAEARAKREPGTNFVAVERLLGRAKKIAKKAVRNDLVNLKVLRIESWYFIKNLCAPESLAAITLRYPDPWPKRRHQGNRILNRNFAEDAARAVARGGLLKLTTDASEYFEWACREMADSVSWIPDSSWTGEREPTSEFEELFAKEEREVYRRAWRKA